MLVLYVVRWYEHLTTIGGVVAMYDRRFPKANNAMNASLKITIISRNLYVFSKQ